MTKPRIGLQVLFLISLSTPTIPAQQIVPRIIGGQPTDEFPTVGIVGSWQLGGFCTGTLISPLHVLTAAHCAEVMDGASDAIFELGGEVYQASQIYLHPQYDSRTLANDIAILELSEPVNDVLPSEIFRGIPEPGDELVIVGFGGGGDPQSGDDGTFGVKMAGVTTIDEVTETLVIWQFDNILESNTAAGDSGGPGFIEVEGAFFIASVTSAGTEPDAILGDIAFNTRVDVFAEWIDAVLEPNGEEDTNCSSAHRGGQNPGHENHPVDHHGWRNQETNGPRQYRVWHEERNGRRSDRVRRRNSAEAVAGRSGEGVRIAQPSIPSARQRAAAARRARSRPSLALNVARQH